MGEGLTSCDGRLQENGPFSVTQARCILSMLGLAEHPRLPSLGRRLRDVTNVEVSSDLNLYQL